MRFLLIFRLLFVKIRMELFAIAYETIALIILNMISAIGKNLTLLFSGAKDIMIIIINPQNKFERRIGI